MGFAGQVFAARVAVGLALPSPRAFSQAGQMIGGFAAKMYNSLEQQSVRAGSKQLEQAQKRQKQAQSALKKHQQSQSSLLQSAADTSIGRLNKAYSGLKTSAATSQAAVKGLKKQLGDTNVRTKLFANIADDMSDAKQYEQMMKNFIGLQAHERSEIIKSYKARELALESALKDEEVRKFIGEEGIQHIKEELAWIQEQRKEFEHFGGERKRIDEEYNADHKKLTDKKKKADLEVLEIEKRLNKERKDAVAIQEHLTRAGNDFVVMLKQNFFTAVRDSVSALTAFYYKLNENTQELINFERELLNANSVFRVTNDELFDVGNQVVQFGQKFGLEMQNGAEGLYQLASAGLSAADSATVLTETLKLAMAVQGDHNTISKLVTQTLFGFEMEMNQAGEVADKFAFAIQKSLIEYEDLASAVKFALPFFTTTGQSIDQLLGALQILTNRALEAGIAGRGLRQGVAELAESIGDASANFRQFGVEVTDNEGNMLQLTEIAANFHDVLEEGVINDTELLTTLIEDLNVRGATAFVHLVQASDEFTQAVESTANAGGELDAMVKIQNESISAQMQILRNNVSMMFLYQDAQFEGTGYLNAFHEAIILTIQDFQNLLVVQQDGVYVLTAFGQEIQDIAISGVGVLRDLLSEAVPLIRDFVHAGGLGFELLKLYAIPLKIMLDFFQLIGPEMTKVVFAFYLLSGVIPLATAAGYANQMMQLRGMAIRKAEMAQMATKTTLATGETAAVTTMFFWTKIMDSWRLSKSIPSRLGENAAATYSNTLKILGITLTAAESKKLTKNTFIRHLNTAGIKTGTIANQGQNAALSTEIILQEASIFARIKATLWRWYETAASYASFSAITAYIGGIIRETAVNMWNILVKMTSVMWSNFYTVAKWYQTYATTANTAATGANTFAVVMGGLALFGYAVVMTIATIAAWLFAAPLAAIAGALLAIFSPVVLVVAAIVLFAAVCYVAYQRLNELIDVGYYFNQMIGAVVGMFKWLAYWTVMPFIWLGEAIYNILEGPLFKFILFVKHIGMMLKWLVFDVIIAAFAGDVGHSTLSDVLMRPFNAAKDAVIWLVGVIYSNSDSLYNRLVELWTWITGSFLWEASVNAIKAAWEGVQTALSTLWNYLDTTFDLSGKFDAMKTAAGEAWDFIKNTFTWSSISGAFKAIGDGILGLFFAPINALKTIWNAAIDLISGKSISFGGKYGVPKITIGIPNLDSWKMNVDTAGVMSAASSAMEAIGTAVPEDELVGHYASAGTLDSVAANRQKDYTDYDTQGLANGGYVKAMQRGGLAGRFPYLVGERGAELFMPQGAGKIIPNKDLNTQRVKGLLAEAFGLAPRTGAADKVHKLSGTLKVDRLDVQSAKMKKSRFGVDTFA